MLFYLIVAVFCPVLWNGELELKKPKYFLRSCPLSQNFYLWLLVPWFPWLHTNWNIQWFPPPSQEHFLFLRKFGMGKVQGSLDVHQFGVPMQVKHATRSKNYNALLVSWAEMQPAWALKCYGSQVTESSLSCFSLLLPVSSILRSDHNIRVTDFTSGNNGGFQNLEFYKEKYPLWPHSHLVYTPQRCFWSPIQMNSQWKIILKWGEEEKKCPKCCYIGTERYGVIESRWQK